MRIVAVSDSHGNFRDLRRVFLAQDSADIFIHLGDGEDELSRLRVLYPQKHILSVRGNTDWSSQNGVSCTVICQGKRVFFTHGHTFFVKSGLEQLMAHVDRVGADIVMYGHTHVAKCHYENGVQYVNPGSLTSPREGPPSYAIIDITDAGVFPAIIAL